jgi:peptidoglycan hydrolase-like protein with peptidoglycan-binding domain
MKTLFVALSLSLLLTFGISAQTAPASAAAEAAKPAETAKKPAVFRPTKDQVKQVQVMLKDKKLYTGEATGKYNDDTRTGIRSFQKGNGLAETGTLNRATLEKFGVALTDSQRLIPVSESSYATADTKTSSVKAEREPNTAMKTVASAPAAAKTKKPAPFRATKDQVTAAQNLMKSKGMFTGEAAGKLDDATRESLKKYQEANGLKVTGTLNQVTLEKMGIPLTDSQKAAAAANTASSSNK